MLFQMPKKAEENLFVPDCEESKGGQNSMSKG